ncbi:putative bifunctional diguanylate cyclase/phosphodiesterase [Xaviernesmea oryzae]|nr:EAL domain-containing protein [Xaviernesmea oryzae]SEL91016.1 diguanylate cyclase (GGDEF) domain-containing protein [Xaviernesmea oryzae]
MTASALNEAIVLDKLRAVRKTVAISIPVNILLGIAALAVSISAGKGQVGALWFAFSLTINLVRLFFCRQPIQGDRAEGAAARRWSRTVRHNLVLHCVLAFLSGFAWALIPLLCEGYTTPETIFYLTVVCGITAGAVTHGFAYALIPISFITPPLVSVIGCLIYAGGYDRHWLAATVLLYLLALIRGARVGEALVTNESRLKNEATLLSRSLETANQRITLFAREMRERAIHDELTGLLNRRGFGEAVLARTELGTSQTLFLLDLDGFKTINDAFGHKTGDMILVEVARRLTANVPAGAVVARLGGDEFAVLIADPQAENTGEALASALITAIGTPFPNLPAGRIGVSIGIYHGADRGLDDLLVSADVALYAAKAAGRNRYYSFDETLSRKAAMTRDIERDLSAALDEGAIVMWYQPILSDCGTQLTTLEALVRWNHPRHGFIPPMDLIAVSALAGLSGELLRHILRQVAQMIGVLRARGLHDIRIAMNVSPRDMTQMPVDTLVLDELAALDLPPEMLELEITEEIAIDPAAVRGKLSRLADAGIRIAIDDFGTGYSSLSALQTLKVDRVKIDKSFVRDLSASPVHQALIDAIMRVSQPFGFDVVAEGVETQADLDILQKLGCTIVQGYHLAKPMPQDDALAWIERHHQG